MHEDHLGVAETVTRLFHALDDRDWDVLAGLVSDPIDVDYPSKEGGAEVVPAPDFVAGLRAFLPGFDATQHLLGPIVVYPVADDARAATARFDARVTHLVADADGPLWTISCRYTFGLRRNGSGWVVASSRVVVPIEEGNRGLEALARRRAAAGDRP